MMAITQAFDAPEDERAEAKVPAVVHHPAEQALGKGRPAVSW
jgi:hypothetical protein